MGKIVSLWILLTVWGMTAERQVSEEAFLHACLQCHQKEQIPSNLVYRRYLMRYSTPERIANAMFRYLKHPEKSASIMPRQFFLKFPMKERSSESDEVLKAYIMHYIEKFDIRKSLILPQTQNRAPL